jgi:tripartite-type tricarboxylate transporter receptor subunit TctC
MTNMMNRSRRAAVLTLLCCLPVVVSPSLAQAPAAWPEKAMHFVVPYPPGTPPDILTRYVADRLSKDLHQPVLVENKVGAGGSIGTEYVARAKPDGYTFLVTPSGTMTIAPAMQKLGYGVDDFIAVAELGEISPIATVRPDAPFASFKEFVAAAKANPGKYTFASNGPGSATQLIGKILHKQAGISVVEVPYKGATESMTDLIAGRVDIMYAPVTVPLIKAGRLKGLAMVSDRRNPEIPDVPTLGEQGFDVSKVPGNWFGIFAPKGVAEGIAQKLAGRVQQIMQASETRQTLQPMSIEVAFRGPQDFGKLVRADAAAMRAVIQSEGLQAK